MKKTITVLLSFLFVALWFAEAKLAVDFTPSTTDGAHAFCPGRGRRATAIKFSETTPHNPQASKHPNYDGGKSPVFYSGGEFSTASNGEHVHSYRVDDSTPLLVIDSQDIPLNTKCAFIHFWKKENFLNDLNTAERLSLTLDDEMSIKLRGFWGNPIEVRWIIQEGSSWYISVADEEDFTSTGTKFRTCKLKNPTTAIWYSYDPVSTVLGMGSSATPTFKNITALGIYTKVTNLGEGTDGTRTIIEIEEFTATASIP